MAVQKVNLMGRLRIVSYLGAILFLYVSLHTIGEGVDATEVSVDHAKINSCTQSDRFANLGHNTTYWQLENISSQTPITHDLYIIEEMLGYTLCQRHTTVTGVENEQLLFHQNGAYTSVEVLRDALENAVGRSSQCFRALETGETPPSSERNGIITTYETITSREQSDFEISYPTFYLLTPPFINSLEIHFPVDVEASPDGDFRLTLPISLAEQVFETSFQSQFISVANLEQILEFLADSFSTSWMSRPAVSSDDRSFQIFIYYSNGYSMRLIFTVDYNKQRILIDVKYIEPLGSAISSPQLSPSDLGRNCGEFDDDLQIWGTVIERVPVGNNSNLEWVVLRKDLDNSREAVWRFLVIERYDDNRCNVIYNSSSLQQGCSVDTFLPADIDH